MKRVRTPSGIRCSRFDGDRVEQSDNLSSTATPITEKKRLTLPPRTPNRGDLMFPTTANIWGAEFACHRQEHLECRFRSSPSRQNGAAACDRNIWGTTCERHHHEHLGHEFRSSPSRKNGTVVGARTIWWQWCVISPTLGGAGWERVSPHVGRRHFPASARTWCGPKCHSCHREWFFCGR